MLMLGVCLSLMAVACTDSEDSEEVDRDTFGEFLVAAETAAKSANLSLDDFPTGWTSEKASEDDEDDTDLGLSEECQILDSDNFPGEVFEADSDDFTGPDGQTVSSSATVLTSYSAAENAIEEFLKASSLQECKTELAEAFVTMFQEDQGINAEVSLKDVSFPKIGESSAAYRLLTVVPDFDLELILDLVVVQQGKMLGTLTFTSAVNIKPDADEEADLGEKFSAKITAAEATLPD